MVMVNQASASDCVTFYSAAMHSRARCLLRGVALGTTVLVFAACGGDGGNERAEPTTTLGSTAQPTTLLTTTLAPATSSTSPSSTRISVSTTLPPVPGETMIDRTFVPEKTTDFSVGQSRINGVSFSNALIIYSSRSPGRIEIDGARSRKRFRGILGVPDDQPSASSHQVDISLDNGPTVFSTVLNFGETKEIDLDVTGALRIKVTVTNRSSESSYAYVAIGNPRFT